MLGVSHRLLKTLPLGAAVAWVFSSSLHSYEGRPQQRLGQITYTEECLAARLELLRDVALRSERKLSCLDDMAGAPLFDAWGRLARCEMNDTTISLISAGPDQEFNSADDIELSASLTKHARLSRNE